MKAGLAWGLFVVAVAGVVALAIGLLLRRSDPSRVPDFTLVERSGRPITRRDLLGEAWVADFVFTRCQLTCTVMNSVAYGLRERVPGVTIVSFTVDPEHDTPERLRAFTEANRLAQPGWFWVTGSLEQVQDVAKNGFKLSVAHGLDPKEPIIHSNRFVVVDRLGRIRGHFAVTEAGELKKDTEAIARMEELLRRVVAERTIPLKSLPATNAALNGTSAMLLVAGFLLIKSKRVGAHRACMLGALAASALFLACYLVSHYYVGSVKYPREDWTRPLYFAILISHSILAALIVPLVGITLTRAFQERFDRHRAIARWTLPLWLYVSVTGVVLYFMLY